MNNIANRSFRTASAVVGLLLLAAVAALTAAGTAHAQDAPSICGDLHNGYGPFDYRTDRDKLPIVNDSHFTPQVENLIRGVSGPIGAELDYVLRAFPNHHRALVAMRRLAERQKTEKPQGARYTVECYFDRAMRFARDDAVVRMLFAQYLGKAGKTEQALRVLDATDAMAGESGFTHYNLGLVYMEFGQHDRALAQAHRAQALGFERPALRQQLERAGKWQDAPP